MFKQIDNTLYKYKAMDDKGRYYYAYFRKGKGLEGVLYKRDIGPSVLTRESNWLARYGETVKYLFNYPLIRSDKTFKSLDQLYKTFLN